MLVKQGLFNRRADTGASGQMDYNLSPTACEGFAQRFLIANVQFKEFKFARLTDFFEILLLPGRRIKVIEREAAESDG
jgi:hypothetical protein